jgi:hypothetical protein
MNLCFGGGVIFSGRIRGIEMEKELRLDNSDDGQRVEIDILKILEQMGIDKQRWPQEWIDTAGEKSAT